MRGNATVLQITIKNSDGEILTARVAKGDPRIDIGKENIRRNVQTAIAEAQ